MSSIIDSVCSKCGKPITTELYYKGKVDELCILIRECNCKGTDWEIAYGETQDEFYTRLGIPKVNGEWILGSPSDEDDKNGKSTINETPDSKDTADEAELVIVEYKKH